MLTLLLTNDNINDADDADDADNADDINDVNDVNVVHDADANDADDERKRKSFIEKRKESRLDISLDRVEQLVMCCFFASLAVNQVKFINKFALSKINNEINIFLTILIHVM
jgi:hypothetical protein